MNSTDRTIDYIEFPATDLEAIKTFYGAVFGWEFTDYGPAYTSFKDGVTRGGFHTESAPTGEGTLAVIYAEDLAALEVSVRENGGAIVKETFEFPGGRRFHFTDPSGNQLAVWSDK